MTRCRSASCPFFAVFGFRKSRRNILRIGRNKSQSRYFTRHDTEPERETEEGTRVATPYGGLAPWPRSHMVWAPYPSTNLALSPTYMSPRDVNPTRIRSPQKVPQRRRHRRGDLGDISLYSGTLPGQGIAPGAISIDSTVISIAVANSHDEEGVVVPRG